MQFESHLGYMFSGPGPFAAVEFFGIRADEPAVALPVPGAG